MIGIATIEDLEALSNRMSILEGKYAELIEELKVRFAEEAKKK